MRSGGASQRGPQGETDVEAEIGLVQRVEVKVLHTLRWSVVFHLMGLLG